MACSQAKPGDQETRLHFTPSARSNNCTTGRLAGLKAAIPRRLKFLMLPMRAGK